MKVPQGSYLSILTARGLDATTVAKRTGIAATRLAAALEGSGELTEPEIEAFADELAVEPYTLFAERPVQLFSAVDFRTATPGITKFQKGTLRAISYMEKLSNTFASLGVEVALDRRLKPVATTFTNDEAISLAKKWRNFWGYTTDSQLEDQDANKVYVSLRGFIESLGVAVIHHSFKNDEAAGIYAHINDGPHIIAINTTNSSKARKLFTLAHEFCHVLIRQEGASNPSVIKNRIEAFCNKFAAYLIAPDDLIKRGLSRFGYHPSAANDFIRLFSKKLGISQEALLIRLVERGDVSSAEYTRWRSQFNQVTPPGDQSDGTGGQSNPLQTKRTTYGSLILSLLADAKRRGSLDEIDIYKISGLKPKYQNELFGTA